MSGENTPIGKDQLARNTVLAVVSAAILLIIIVLPAEYDIDPTGIGAALGIKGLSNQAEVETKSPDTVSQDPSTAQSPLHTNFDPALKFVNVELILEPYGQGEFKLKTSESARLSYLWDSGTDLVYADLHGHTLIMGEAGEEEEIVVRYLETQEGTSESGQFETPFKGDHGWYFLNLETRPVRIKVSISGTFDSHEYIDIGPQI
ncbi:MAG: hypothetical protein HOL98_13440 [Gammaproteobacteria bacterium]|jgi:hypothetical protein|nr:hypothetical protein [Gammaproteobacteria bacterium]MBT5204454.1 hypothetical protein [Gammaproteobacteria bacterium]MBT5601092.1 hypothetical protein [Gammaproteobacteria bacterium]